ncbi:MAG TPA: hypothetical protein VJU82_12795, partial [Acidobacteriaceae bacterium]|nr:hypothetical protein [Acidobacteriaceae bacterium]
GERPAAEAELILMPLYRALKGAATPKSYKPGVSAASEARSYSKIQAKRTLADGYVLLRVHLWF